MCKSHDLVHLPVSGFRTSRLIPSSHSNFFPDLLFNLRPRHSLKSTTLPNIMPPRTGSEVCMHRTLTFTPSSHAPIAGYKQPTAFQRAAATNPSGAIPKSRSKSSQTQNGEEIKASTFPAPLVLPGDELSWDPDYPAQSVKEWIEEEDRNEVTEERRVLYMVSPPAFGAGAEFIEEWKIPVSKGKKERKERVEWTVNETDNVLGYLGAFYYGMEVRMLPQKLCFAVDVDDVDEVHPPPTKKTRKGSGKPKPKEEKSPTLWLDTNTNAGLIGIRTRATPSGLFSHQLNLNDLLDAAIEILPEDAYALLMLVEHDIFEDEEDDFACGRAYGGSRIAVVSTARYRPDLDEKQGIEREHGWPASHCSSYIEKCIRDSEEDDEVGQKSKKKRSKNMAVENEGGRTKGGESPMYAAVSAHLSPPLDPTSLDAISGLWLARVCRTASHELGHCFGIDHCVYYACCMQGTASVIEDARQPPYLCPVDLQKVLRATGADERERYEKMREMCGRFAEVQLFATFGKWIDGRVGELDGWAA